MSALLLWWTLHDVDLAKLWTHIRNVRVVPALAAVAVATASFPLRTVRWRFLLRLEGVTLPFMPLWHATAVGFMANNLLPARAGELARAFVASRLTRAKFTTALASIAIERVLDGLTLVTLLTVAIWAGGFAPDTTVAGVTPADVARGAAIGFTVLLGALLVLVHFPEPVLALANRIGRRLLPARWAEKGLETLRGLLSGLEVLKNPGRFVAAAFWSFVVWGTVGASFWLAFTAFATPAPWSAALMLVTLVAFGVAIPSTPGFFGPFEAATRVAFMLYGLDATRAAAYAVSYHLATFIPITLLGMWSLSRAHLHLSALRHTEPHEGPA